MRRNTTLMSFFFAFCTSILLAGKANAQSSKFEDLKNRISMQSIDVYRKATESPYVSDGEFELFDESSGNTATQRITEKSMWQSNLIFASVMDVTFLNDISLKTSLESRASVRNTKYEFLITKPYESNGWVIRESTVFNTENQLGLNKPIIYRPINLRHFTHLHFGAFALSDVVKRSNFVITNAIPSVGNPSCLRIDFIYKDASQPKQVYVHEGWIELDEKAAWCVKSSDYATTLTMPSGESKYKFASSNQYHMSENGIPVLDNYIVQNEFRIGEQGNLKKNKVKFTFKTRYIDSIDEKEFTLSAFNLPEPVGVSPFTSPRSGYMRYLYIAIPAFAALGLLSAYIRRRYHPPAVTLPSAGTAGS